MNREDEEFVRYIERLYGNKSDAMGSNVRRLCRIVKEEDKHARHAEQERDAFNARIDELEAEVAKLKPMPSRKDIALALLRGIGPNPAEFMATGKDAFLGLADRLIEMFNGKDKP